MVVKQEIGKGINGKRGFPYGDGVIMKVDCEIPMCTVEKSSEIFEQVEDENENTDSLDEIEKNQDLKMFFENSINYTINPRVVVQECNSTKDPYDEDMAEVKYLYSKPVAFIIIGKPSPDNMKLGQKLATYWGCLYIDPITCFNMEPEEADSPVLLWCRKHLSEGRKIPSEIVMRVMEQRALSNE
ncbi:Adenylate kinase 9, partial [Gryllus bimaculatus]